MNASPGAACGPGWVHALADILDGGAGALFDRTVEMLVPIRIEIFLSLLGLGSY